MSRLSFYILLGLVLQTACAHAMECWGMNIRTGERQRVIEREGLSPFWAYADWDLAGRPRITYNHLAFHHLPDFMRKFTQEHECCHHKIYAATGNLNAMLDEVEASCCALRTKKFSTREIKSIGNYFERFGPLPPQYFGSGKAYWQRIKARCPEAMQEPIAQAEIDRPAPPPYRRPGKHGDKIVLVEHKAAGPLRYALFRKGSMQKGWTPTGRTYCGLATMIPRGQIHYEFSADTPRRYGLWPATRKEPGWHKTGGLMIAPPSGEITLNEVMAANPTRFAYFEKGRKEKGWSPTGRTIETVKCDRPK